MQHLYHRFSSRDKNHKKNCFQFLCPVPFRRPTLNQGGGLGNSGGAKCSLHNTGELNVHVLLSVQPLMVDWQ